MAIGRGAVLYERHIGLATDPIKLNKYSMDPLETKKWIEVVKVAEEYVREKMQKR